MNQEVILDEEEVLRSQFVVFASDSESYAASGETGAELGDMQHLTAVSE